MLSDKSLFCNAKNHSTIWFYFFQEVQKLTTVPELELFLLEHGEEVIDMLGQQVDRIEKNIKVKFSSTIEQLPSLMHRIPFKARE